jgi:hypothetical protein
MHNPCCSLIAEPLPNLISTLSGWLPAVRFPRVTELCTNLAPNLLDACQPFDYGFELFPAQNGSEDNFWATIEKWQGSEIGGATFEETSGRLDNLIERLVHDSHLHVCVHACLFAHRAAAR